MTRTTYQHYSSIIKYLKYVIKVHIFQIFQIIVYLRSLESKSFSRYIITSALLVCVLFTFQALCRKINGQLIITENFFFSFSVLCSFTSCIIYKLCLI